MLPLFDFAARDTNLAREVRGGATTFLTMAYVLFANPAILSAAGPPLTPAIAGTAAAAIASILMGAVANVPIALAPGMRDITAKSRSRHAADRQRHAIRT